MKKVFFGLTLIFTSLFAFAQQQGTTEITHRNSWLKAGVNLGHAVGDVNKSHNAVLGLELKGQLMETNHVGIGLSSGYNHFFPKKDFKSFGTVPLGSFLRFYPQASGFFVGSDLGFSLVTKKDAKGGFYLRPQLGYHNRDWNAFAFYNHIFRNENKGGNIAHAGVGVTYNVRFK